MRQTNKAIWTVIDVWIGLGIYFIIFEMIGLIFVENRLSYSLGLLVGCVTAAFLIWNMFVSIDSALDLTPQEAEKFTKKRTFFRGLVMLVVAFLGMRLQNISFTAIIIGMLGLKIAAFMQPYTNLYITKKLLSGAKE